MKRLFLLATLAGLSGCGQDAVVSYRAAKDSGPAPAAPAATTDAAPAAPVVPASATGGTSLVWQAPADWRNDPGHSMRKASFALPGGAEVAITVFPGDVGGILANVNRWRGQAGLAPVDAGGLAQATTTLEAGGLTFTVVDASGGSSPLVAALAPWNGNTWFFKLTGPADVLARSKPAYLAFLQTVRTP